MIFIMASKHVNPQIYFGNYPERFTVSLSLSFFNSLSGNAMILSLRLGNWQNFLRIVSFLKFLILFSKLRIFREDLIFYLENHIQSM